MALRSFCVSLHIILTDVSILCKTMKLTANPTQFIIYYRVSTKQQGESGLGLEAQRSIINHYIDSNLVVAEFTEVASAKNVTDRPILLQAIAECNEHRYTLAVAKLDRLSRKTEDALEVYSELDGRLTSCDIPNLDKFTLTLFMAIADRERELISIRTRDALTERKKRVGEWRKPGKGFRKSDRLDQAVDTNQRKAQINENNRRAAKLIGELRAKGESWRTITDQLNEFGFRTAQNKIFRPTQARRIYLQFC